MQTQGLYTRRRPMLAMMAQEALMQQEALKKQLKQMALTEAHMTFCHVCDEALLNEEYSNHSCIKAEKASKNKKRPARRSKVAK